MNTCPNCGYCPNCGRQSFLPYGPFGPLTTPYPFWQIPMQPTVRWDWAVPMTGTISAPIQTGYVAVTSKN